MADCTGTAVDHSITRLHLSFGVLQFFGLFSRRGINMLRSVFFALALVAAQPVSAQEALDHAQLADPEGEPIVVGSIHRIRSSVYGGEQIITVRLPRGYAEYPDKSYPVLFSVDAGPIRTSNCWRGSQRRRSSRPALSPHGFGASLARSAPEAPPSGQED